MGRIKDSLVPGDRSSPLLLSSLMYPHLFSPLLLSARPLQTMRREESSSGAVSQATQVRESRVCVCSVLGVLAAQRGRILALCALEPAFPSVLWGRRKSRWTGLKDSVLPRERSEPTVERNLLSSLLCSHHSTLLSGDRSLPSWRKQKYVSG